MRILFALTYYRPHVSGLTIYVQRLAEALASRGHRVTVLTSRYDRSLPAEEELRGVRVVRVPVVLRISKGVVMPGYARVAARLIREHDVVAGNLPGTPIETVLLPVLARALRRPVTMTYHCDVQLPAGHLNRVIDEVVFLSALGGVALADRVVGYTEDYARASRVLRRFPQKWAIIPPPVEMPRPTPEQVDAFRRRFDLHGRTVVGFVARFATEKGVEYVLNAIPRLLTRVPDALILFAGEHRNVVGEADYRARLQPLLERHTDRWRFTGVLDPVAPDQLASFYATSAVTILPSINRTESFGLVQVESMLCGTPVVASDLPGVRQPIRTTGMGRIVPPRDAEALADAIVEVLHDRARHVRPREAISALYSVARSADEYERLFDVLGSLSPSSTPPARR